MLELWQKNALHDSQAFVEENCNLQLQIGHSFDAERSSKMNGYQNWHDVSSF
jgi:hypothetical protein